MRAAYFMHTRFGWAKWLIETQNRFLVDKNGERYQVCDFDGIRCLTTIKGEQWARPIEIKRINQHSQIISILQMSWFHWKDTRGFAIVWPIAMIPISSSKNMWVTEIARKYFK